MGGGVSLTICVTHPKACVISLVGIDNLNIASISKNLSEIVKKLRP